MAYTEINKKEEVYSDMQTSFAMHPIKRDLSRITNEDAVKRSIRNILLTNYYERPFRPRFGANLTKHLFETITSVTLDIIKDEITAAINTYEPRATLLDVVVSGTDRNEVDVSIIFSIINKSEPINFNTTIALDRVR